MLPNLVILLNRLLGLEVGRTENKHSTQSNECFAFGKMLTMSLPCRNAFGPSAGTICLSGLLICVVRMVRAAVDSARQEDTRGIVNLVLQCCVNSLLTAIDFLNKFTINFAAITGEAYCSSARMTYELLRRNLLSAVFVETISTRLLAGIVLVLSAVYTIVVRYIDITFFNPYALN